MTTLPENIIEQLIQMEADIHYDELPPTGQQPFTVIQRASPVILSAPHGAITFRNNHTETWHEEDEYTAGMALLLSKLCGTSVIATTWKTADSDPNEHDEERSPYKQALRQLAQETRARWLIDLHGAGEDNPHLFEKQKVDLGAGSRNKYLPAGTYKNLVRILNDYLGKDVAHRRGLRGFPAADDNRLAAYAHRQLGLGAVQIEMKPSVRVPLRRARASALRRNRYALDGQYSAPPQDVVAMMQAFAKFIEYLKAC